MRDLYYILSPFIAAFLASFLTYYFTIRTKRHEALIAQRLPAFKAIQKQLVAIKHYCDAKSGVLKDSDSPLITLKMGDLSPEENKSALEHLTELRRLMDDNLIFLSKASRDIADEIFVQLYILHNGETISASQSVPLHGSVYSHNIDLINRAIQGLHDELKLPR